MTTPSHIGQYRIVRKLGAGGMGMVFLGEHMLLGRRAAIKTLLPTVQVNQEIVERFFNEARAASAITDPGVIQIFDFGYHVDGTAYIVMELLEGEALSARIDRVGKLPLPDAIRIARQIAGSLAAAHARNIVHRDLKPENIFLVRDAEAQGGERTKILDFGICKLSQADGDVAVTQVGAMVGTPVYMSPEQCRGASDVDHRSDIYAFGCLVFHMLTGRPPFVGESSGDLIVAHMQADPPAPSLYVSGLPFEVDALLLRCLAKAPEDRFSSMSELHLVLGDIYAQLDPVDYTATPVTPAMQLGQGFRSVYDGNFSRIAGGSSRISPLSRIVPGCGTPGSKATPGSKSFPASRATGCRVSPAPRTSPATHRLRPHLRFVSTPPVTPPKLRLPSTDITDSDPELAALLRPRRRALHAVIAGIVVAGVVIGLAVGGLFQDGEDRTAVARPVAAPPSTDTTSAASTAETSTAAASTSDGSMTGAFASPTVVDSTSQTDRTVERASAHEAAVATKPAIPSAPTAGIRAETTRSSAVADTKSGAPARPVVETRSDPAETPSVDSASAADDKAADSERVATSEAGKPALEVKPELAKPDVPKPELGKRASARVASGAATRPSERSRTSKSGDSKPVVSPSEAESSGKSDRGMVTSLKKPDADKKSDTDAPKSGASSSASSTPTPSRPSAPSNPSPSRPSPSNEDLYDTR